MKIKTLLIEAEGGRIVEGINFQVPTLAVLDHLLIGDGGMKIMLEGGTVYMPHTPQKKTRGKARRKYTYRTEEIRVPAYTKPDGTKVKAHVRRPVGAVRKQANGTTAVHPGGPWAGWSPKEISEEMTRRVKVGLKTKLRTGLIQNAPSLQK